MSGTTPRFGFTWFDGASQTGAISDDGNKYTGSDRQLLDRVLTALEGHDHAASASTASTQPDGPSLAYASTGGSLQAGKTYFYKIAFVDAAGLETDASDEVSVVLPDQLTQPAAPSAENGSTGSMPAGLYFYSLTAVRGLEESTQGSSVPVTVLTAEHSVTLTLPALGEADSYYVWRMSDVDGQWRKFSTPVSSGSFVDNGSATPTVTSPPVINTGVSSYTTTITLTTGDQTAVQLTSGWRIYRSTTSGTYGGNSLVHEVVERVDELDPESLLVTAWVDSGDVLTTGQPLSVASRLSFTRLHLSEFTTNPSLTGYPNNALISVAGTVKMKFGGAWVAVGSGGGVGTLIPVGSTLPSTSGWSTEHDGYLFGLSADGQVTIQVWVLGTGWISTGGSGGISVQESLPATTGHTAGDAVVTSGDGALSVLLPDTGGTNAWMTLIDRAGASGQVFTSSGGRRWVLTVDDTGTPTFRRTFRPGPPPPTGWDMI
jgi:hypothetical protein